jgi:hypothetical protein
VEFSAAPEDTITIPYGPSGFFKMHDRVGRDVPKNCLWQQFVSFIPQMRSASEIFLSAIISSFDEDKKNTVVMTVLFNE